jgi:hypothetical protein
VPDPEAGFVSGRAEEPILLFHKKFHFMRIFCEKERSTMLPQANPAFV